MTVSRTPPGSGSQPGEISLPRLLAFALPAMPVAAFQLPFVILVPKFYGESLGLGMIMVGVIIGVVRFIDAFLDPVVGYLADHTRSRWGRRRTWFALAAIPTTVGAFFIFNPFPDVSETNTLFWAAWFFVWSMMLSVGYTALSLTHLSWGAEVSLSYFGRNRIFAAREVLAVLGTLIATALPWLLFRFGLPGDDTVLTVLGITVAISLPVFTLLTVVSVPEPPHVHQHHLNFIEGLKGLFANEHFIRLLGAYAFANMGNGLPASLLLYFARDYVHATEDAQRFFLLLYLLSGVVSTPFWLWLSRRTSKHRAWCYAMLVACAGFVWTPLIGYDVLGPMSPWAFGAIMVLAGMSVGADLMLPVSMQADVIDVDTARSGEQHSGFYFAAWALANKLALAVALGFGLVILGIAGFKDSDKSAELTVPHDVSTLAGPSTEGAVTIQAPAIKKVAVKPVKKHRHKHPTDNLPVKQTPLAKWTLVFLYCVVPILLKFAAIRLVWNFPIGADEQARLRAVIEAQLQRDEDDKDDGGRPAPSGAH
ncbi:MAG: MFS transporter [Ancalomicrobiaceae bacterium]|nr:MFS transporter [Ancalomicrobiaceae bacterium]